ncbi:MAG TPA: hypothetical protein VNN80_07785 [Polyangiaceae bacterium]|jgi:hypothetical protein|nr:hypothetical protein [Polyangiaceae bacterium]
MNAKGSGALIGPEGKRPAPWRSSLYEEPMWVSLAWVIGPVAIAAIAIYFAVR